MNGFRIQRFYLLLGAGMAAGIVLIQWVSLPDAAGDSEPLLSLSEITPSHGIEVAEAKAESATESFLTLTVSHPGGSQPVRILDYWVPSTFSAHSYALAGEVAYRTQSAKPGYLETWNIVADSPDGSQPMARYFSRTLGSGLMAPIQGTSGFRAFVLPFFLEKETRKPVRLQLNLVLPEAGVVQVRKLRFIEGWGTQAGAWFSMQQEGDLGAVIGGVFGLWAALLGIGRGIWPDRAAAFVRASCQIWIACGSAALGILAWACLAGQPWWVREQFALCGVLLLVTGIGLHHHEEERRQRETKDGNDDEEAETVPGPDAPPAGD